MDCSIQRKLDQPPPIRDSPLSSGVPTNVVVCWTWFGWNTLAVPRTPPMVIGEVAVITRLVCASVAVTEPSRSEHAALAADVSACAAR